jgi:large subunit ribosomal protein L5
MSKKEIPTSLPEPRLRRAYREEVSARVLKEFGMKNIHQLPRIDKVVINVGVGRHLENQKLHHS